MGGFDTMASVNVVSGRYLSTYPGTYRENISLRNSGHRRLHGIGGSITVGRCVIMTLRGARWLVETEFYVVEDLPESLDALLGLPWMRLHNTVIDTAQKTIQVESEYDPQIQAQATSTNVPSTSTSPDVGTNSA